MAIETTEQAKEYIGNVKKHLKELTILSQEAGLNTHASMWLCIMAAFLEDYDSVKEIIGMFGIYLKHKTMRIFE